jgi:hypothetical protein
MALADQWGAAVKAESGHIVDSSPDAWASATRDGGYAALQTFP